MENNPIYENTLRHFLNFKSPNLGRFEITEPLNFDSFAYKIKQNNNRFGRDKEIAGDEIDLEFIDVFAEPTDTPQVLTNGIVTHHLSHRLDLILEAIRINGSEAEIEYILQNGNQDFVTGLLDIPESTTDGYSYFKCSVIQNTSKALIERKKDVKVNVFSDKDTFGDYIEPLQKERLLLKSLPINQSSTWNTLSPFIRTMYSGDFDSYFFDTVNLEKYDIKSSFVPFDYYLEEAFKESASNFRFIKADNLLQNISFKYKTTIRFSYVRPDPVFPSTGYKVSLFVFKCYESDFTTTFDNSTPVWESPEIIETIAGGYYYNFDIDIDMLLPNILSGESLYVFYRLNHLGATTYGSIRYLLEASEMNIIANSTSVDVVVDAVKYIDYLKQGVKSISKLSLEAPSIDTGEFKDQFVFNGNMLRLRDDVSFNFEFKDEMDDLQETNSDYQIFDDKVLIQEYPDFYRNVDLGAFYQVPEVGFEQSFNDRFKKITMEYGYKNYEQNKDQENTINAFQTESQWLFPNKQVDDELKVDINHTRDPYTIETAKTEAISSTTALSSDSKVFIVDCVPLPENSTNSVTREFTMLVEPNGISWFLKIRATGFNWINLGIAETYGLSITFGENIGDYNVVKIEGELLTLEPIDTNVPDFSGVAILTIRYYLIDVSWVNRTNEDFNIIESINAPDVCSNLKYSIKRNLTRPAWSSYLNTICSDYPNGSILNTDFEVNGNLKTQFNGGQVLIEKDPMQISTLAPKIINKTEISTKIKVGFYQAKDIIDGVINRFGFIRVIDTQDRIVKLYPKQINMLWSEGVMDIVGEVKAEIDVINIYFSGNEVVVEGIGYDQPIRRSLRWFKIDASIYVQLFDNDSKPLINPTDYRKISINGILYTNEIDFYNALNN